MIVCISGTPGTGKTETAKTLAKMLGANLVLISELNIRGRKDMERDTKIVDMKEVRQKVKKALKPGTNIVEGHLSHHLSYDFLIILRTRPDILEKRLAKKGWSPAKVAENVQAEILDAVTAEAMAGRKKAVEIDTTRKTPRQSALILKRLLNNFPLRKKYRPGKINWSKYSDYLIRKVE